MTAYQREVRGLVVARHGQGWDVTHAGSGLAATPKLRQRRFAEQARDELLATGADFTRSSREVGADRGQWADVYWRWQKRAKLTSYDDTTGEYYSPHVSYGVLVPSAAWAQAYRDALAANDHARLGELLNTRKAS